MLRALKISFVAIQQLQSRLYRLILLVIILHKSVLGLAEGWFGFYLFIYLFILLFFFIIPDVSPLLQAVWCWSTAHHTL